MVTWSLIVSRPSAWYSVLNDEQYKMKLLTQWGWATHEYINGLIGFSGLSPARQQTIVWTSTSLLSTWIQMYYSLGARDIAFIAYIKSR